MGSHHADDQILTGLRDQLATLDQQISVPDTTYFSAPSVDLENYDNIVVCMSGGKDSIACLLHLLDAGADRSKIELWHHDIDGREGSSLMDWPFMADYNRKIAEAFNIPIYFSWLEGGFEGEMIKENAYSRPHIIETPDGLIKLERDKTRSKPSTRLKFPQVSANLATRWCSSALKIDVGRRAVNNQSRFNNTKTLFVTGERRQESSNRAKYNQLEAHACDRRSGRMARHVDAWRPVLDFSEEEIWELLKKHHVIAPVPYRLGWSRSSCMTCIYNSPKIWATIDAYFPERTRVIANYEGEFGISISRTGMNVLEQAASSRPIPIDDIDALNQAHLSNYILPVIDEVSEWIVPKGAFNSVQCGAA